MKTIQIYYLKALGARSLESVSQGQSQVVGKAKLPPEALGWGGWGGSPVASPFSSLYVTTVHGIVSLLTISVFYDPNPIASLS